MNESVSVVDVAARAGVSLGTVSNVLNHPQRVAPATRDRVMAAIRDLGFVRNEAARQLRAGSSRTIGLVVLDVGNPFFTDLAAGVEASAAPAGLSVVLCNSNDDTDRESHYLGLLQEQRAFGILITPVGAETPGIDAARRTGTPVVLVDRGSDRRECSVSVNDHVGGELAVAHLIDQGHRRIGFVGGPFAIRQVSERLAGARAALRAGGLRAASLVVIETPRLDVASGRATGARIAAMPLPRRPTAVFCANDLLALGLLQDMTRRRIAVPGDLAIVGLRRHRVRCRGGRAADLGAAATCSARSRRNGTPARRGHPAGRPRTPAGRLRTGAGRARVDRERRRMKIALFATCLVDGLFPDVGKATTGVLRRLGHQVEMPLQQTCCGQMHVNTGYPRDALPLVRNHVRAFESYDVIVAPSGSCVGAIRHQHADVAEQFGDPTLAAAAGAVAARTYELSELLVDVLGVTDVGAYYPHRVTYHPTCHSLRLLRVAERPYQLLRAVRGIDLVALPDAESCCGFGGTFALKNGDVSSAMLADKIRHVLDTGAGVCAASDSSCLMHIGGGLDRLRSGTRTVHLAEILASTEQPAVVST